MKTTIKLLALLISGSMIFTACKDKNPGGGTTVYYQQTDQMGRPAVNTVFNAAADKDAFNTTVPSAMARHLSTEIYDHFNGIKSRVIRRML